MFQTSTSPITRLLPSRHPHPAYLMASSSVTPGVSTGQDPEHPPPSLLSYDSGHSPQPRQSSSDLPQSDTRPDPTSNKQKSGKGKSKRKTKPLDQCKSVLWKLDHTVMNFLMSKLPQYQLLLAGRNTQKKREWMEDTEGKVVLHCPQNWIDHFGMDHLKKVYMVTILCAAHTSHSLCSVLP